MDGVSARGRRPSRSVQRVRPTSSRATRRTREPPSDAEIERGLREKAVTDPRAAEILLRRLQRPRAEDCVGGVDLDSMAVRELERLYSGLLRLASMDEPVLAALVEQVLAGDELASSSWRSRVNKNTVDGEWHPRERGTPAWEALNSSPVKSVATIPRVSRGRSRLPAAARRSGVSATLGRGCEAFGRGRVREEQQVEQARRIEVGEVRLGESAEGGLVGGPVAGELERVTVGGTFPATGDGG